MPGSELFGQEEKKEVMDVLETGILFRYNHEAQRNDIWKAKTFEQEFAAYYGVKHCHMCSSGTTADDITLAACGVGVGDEVIVPPFTYIAPIEAVLKSGAKPVFAEIDDTLCLSPEGIEAVITPKTKALMLIHMCGAMAKIEEIVAICKKHNILLIEDAAQAIGATFNGKKIGTFGDIACYSFDFFKTITAGEGGAITTNNDTLYEKSHMYADHGHDHIGTNRGAEGHPILGTNYRISELHAAVALAQFRKLPTILENQRKNKSIIKQKLERIGEIKFRHLPDQAGDNASFLSFFMPDIQSTQKLLEISNEKGLGLIYWYDNNFHYLKNWDHLKQLSTAYPLAIDKAEWTNYMSQLELPKTNDLMSRMICIGIKIKWPENEIAPFADQLVQAVKESVSVTV